MKHLLLTTIAAVVLVGCGESPKDIWEAAGTGNITAVKRYLAKGIDLHELNQDGLNPLHKATWHGRKEIVELLIAAGADVNAKRPNGSTPLDLAIKAGVGKVHHTEIADLIREHGGKSGAEDSIQVAVWVGNIEAVKQHLAAGADVNAKDDKFGSTALHSAAKEGHKEIAELLIAGSAEVNARENNKWTPLHYAAWQGHKEVAELLIDKGADVNPNASLHADLVNKVIDFSYEYRTPLDVAIQYKQSETATLLRKHGGKTGDELEAEGK